jgi:hypothetical protein
MPSGLATTCMGCRAGEGDGGPSSAGGATVRLQRGGAVTGVDTKTPTQAWPAWGFPFSVGVTPRGGSIAPRSP